MSVTKEINSNKRLIYFLGKALNPISNNRYPKKHIPLSSKGDIIGTAYDYMAKSILMVKNKSEKNKNIKADLHSMLIKSGVGYVYQETKKYNAGLKSSLEDLFNGFAQKHDMMNFQKRIESDFEIIEEAMVKGKMSATVSRAFLYFARIEQIYKSGHTYYMDMGVTQDEIKDMTHLHKSAIKFAEEIIREGFDKIHYNYDFKYAKEIGGAEPDIIGEKDGKFNVIEIKCVTDSIITNYFVRQLAMYSTLLSLEGKKVGDLNIFFGRHEKYLSMDSDKVINDKNILTEFFEDYYIKGEYVYGLNDNQQKMVNRAETNGSTLVIAGPGSGKTHTLIEMIVKTNEKVKFENMMVITFTKDMALEITERLQKSVNYLPENMHIGTIHAVFLKIIRDGDLINSFDKKGNNFLRDASILSPEQDSQLFTESLYLKLKDEIKAKGEEPSRIVVEKVLADIIGDKYKGKVDSVMNVFRKSVYNCEIDPYDISVQIQSQYNGKVAEAFLDYIDKKGSMNFISFDDILIQTLYHLRNNPDFANQNKKHFERIFIDEFQDTSKLHFEILSHITDGTNITAIGDPFQSIYGFMNANIFNVFDFRDKFAPEIIYLNENYRSEKDVVSMTNAITPHFDLNLEEYGIEVPPLKSASTSGENQPIILAETGNPVITTADMIEHDIMQGVPKNQIAVLYRNNRDPQGITAELKKRGIDFVVSGKGYFEREEIMATMSALYLVIDPKAHQHFIALAKEYSGVGVETTSALQDLIYDEGKQNITSAFLGEHKEYFGGKRLKSLMDFADDFQLISNGDKNYIQKATELIASVGIVDRLVAEAKTAEDMQEIEANVLHFWEIVTDYIQPDMTKKEMTNALEDLIVSKSVDLTSNKDAVQIMTLHKSKGQEWRNVYLGDVSDGAITHTFFTGNKKDDEDLRLLYVGISRAKSNLYMIYGNINKWNKPKGLDKILNNILEAEPTFMKHMLDTRYTGSFKPKKDKKKERTIGN